MELYSVSIEVHFCFGLQQERLCKTDLSGLKLSVSIANPRSKLLTTEVKRIVFKQLGNRLFMFRTWRIRQRNTVWVLKLADIVTSLWLEIIVLPKELFNVTYVCGNLLTISYLE